MLFLGGAVELDTQICPGLSFLAFKIFPSNAKRRRKKLKNLKMLPYNQLCLVSGGLDALCRRVSGGR